METNENNSKEKEQVEISAPNWINMGGDQILAGIKKNIKEYQEELIWYARWSIVERKMSFNAMGEELGVDGSTISRVFRGEYGSNGTILPPPAKMLSRIRVLRTQERERAQQRSAGRIQTDTVKEIWNVCRKAWADGLVAMIFGTTHIGKTEALQWFRDENNHGATIYVDLQGLSGVQDIYREFARALGISPNTPTAKLKPRVISAIDRSNLVIVDEFHYITHAYQKGSAARMISEIKSIKDRTGCAMVICATEIGRTEFESGRDVKLMAQLWRRGTIKLQLPDALRVADVRAICAAYGLEMPAAARPDTWKNLKEENPDADYIGVLEDIAYHQGVASLVMTLKDGNVRAGKAQRDLTWDDLKKVQAIYAAQMRKKTV